MADSEEPSSVLAALLGAQPAYEKHEEPHQFRRHHAGQIVYEDDHVVVIDEGEKETAGGSDAGAWQKRLVLAPKKHVHSLLDLDIADDRTAIHLLHGIQKVALAEDLQNHGFEISIDVLPPRQKSNLLKIKIRSGDKGKVPVDPPDSGS